MSDPPATPAAPLGAGARALIARAAAADRRARVALTAAIDDITADPALRLDDRTRAAFGALVERMATTIEGELRDHAVRVLTTRGEPALADALAFEAPPAIARIAAAGLLRDADFVAECLARVRIELLAAALPFDVSGAPDTPSLIVRLAQSSDRVVASAAAAVLTGENHRRGAAEGGSLTGTGLPAALHARLAWWIAAALRERIAPQAGARLPALDRAVGEAVLRNLAAHDDGDRLEAAVLRLAQAIDARHDELPALLDEALRDRRPILFAGFLAHALGVSYELARALMIDPHDDRLWLACRALDLPRDLIARIGFLLGEADPRRDVETFADRLDAVAAVDPDTASAAIASIRLHPDFRAALLALCHGGGHA